jgi:Spy/CpxP family protein refolding chaperone
MRTFTDPVTRARLTTFALLAFVFLSGSITGIAVKEVLAARTDAATAVAGMDPRECLYCRPGDRPFPPPPGGAFWLLGERGQGFLDVLSERLDLTDAQRERIGDILIEQRARVDASLRQMRPRFEAHLGSTRAAIREVLTPAQRATFERIEAERRDMIQRRHPAFGDSPSATLPGDLR